MDEVEPLEEPLEDPELLPERRPAAAGRRVVDLRGAVLVLGRERVVEVAEDRPAGQQELPGLAAVDAVGRALEAGLVVADAACSGRSSSRRRRAAWRSGS